MAELNPPKIIKITVKGNPLGYTEAKKRGKKVMIYPDVCEIGGTEQMGYCGKAVKAGGPTYVISLVRDSEVFAKYIAHPDVIEITDAEANSLLAERRRKVVEYPALVQSIDIRQRMGKKLTNKDLKAIDPDDPTPGIYVKEFDVKDHY